MEAFSLILLGATGDLAKLKIIPAVFELKKRNLLPNGFSFIGNGRTPMTHQQFRDYVTTILEEKLTNSELVSIANNLLENTYYVQGDLASPQMYQNLSKHLDSLLSQGIPCGNRIFHLAILPQLYETVIENLGTSNLNVSDCGWVRVMIEKPFGENLSTAQTLDAKVKAYFTEEQIYRIDHYLAKETVQNILAFRFANELFEPTLNNQYVDHIQISMLEDFGIKGRGKFYDRTGTVRDVLQNHLLQLLATVTMDRPKRLSSDYIREERLKILKKLSYSIHDEKVQPKAVSGQYVGYRAEKDVPKDSKTETFVALRTEIENERWSGVPIYIRAGKGLCRRVTEVNVVYKDSEMKPSPNVLTFRIQPDESIVLRFFVTKPGPTNELQPANLQFHYKQLSSELMEAYERVLLDAFKGDQTLFTTGSGVEAEWKFVDPLLEKWHSSNQSPHPYEIGSWGPEAADTLMQEDGRSWITPSTDLKIDT